MVAYDLSIINGIGWNQRTGHEKNDFLPEKMYFPYRKEAFSPLACTRQLSSLSLATYSLP
jgi:hypothetical protein